MSEACPQDAAREQPVETVHPAAADRPGLVRRLFVATKWLHKYVGLFLIVFLLWESVTGVLVNHVDLLGSLSTPTWLVPRGYWPVNWNRATLRTMVFSERNPEVAYAAGRSGVWKTTDGGKSFHGMTQGFPRSGYYRRTNSVLLLEKEQEDVLLAATNKGLYACNPEDGAWQPVPLGEPLDAAQAIVRIDERVLVFTSSRAYEATLSPLPLRFGEVPIEALPSDEIRAGERTPLRSFLFYVHSGQILGLPGILMSDAVGIALFFLTFSSAFIWYYHWRRRRGEEQHRHLAGFGHRLFCFLDKYHWEVGIWTSALLLLVGLTSVFLVPPLQRPIEKILLPSRWAEPHHESPFTRAIAAAAYDAREKRVLLVAGEKLFAAPADLSEPLARLDLHVPLAGMEPAVRTDENGDLILRSFRGLYRVQHSSGVAINMVTGEPASQQSRLELGEVVAGGYFRTPEGEEFVTDFFRGLRPLNGAELKGRFEMPQALRDNHRLPLFTFVFLLHNGRIFIDYLGRDNYHYVPFIGGLLFVIITMTGAYDWTYVKLLQHRKRKRRAGESSGTQAPS
jgi:hypothetical protein